MDSAQVMPRAKSMSSPREVGEQMKPRITKTAQNRKTGPTKAAANTLFLDIFSGISGDMFIGALLDLGVDAHELEHELEKLKLDGYHLHVSRAQKAAIEGVKFDVHLAHGHSHDHSHTDGVTHTHPHSHEDHDHAHEHEHHHHHEEDEHHLHHEDDQDAHQHGHS